MRSGEVTEVQPVKNLLLQVHNVCTAPVVQRAWEAGQEVHVHGLVFDVGTGRIRIAAGPFSSAADIQA